MENEDVVTTAIYVANALYDSEEPEQMHVAMLINSLIEIIAENVDLDPDKLMLYGASIAQETGMSDDGVSYMPNQRMH